MRRYGCVPRDPCERRVRARRHRGARDDARSFTSWSRSVAMNTMRCALYLGRTLAAVFLPRGASAPGTKTPAPSGVILFPSDRGGSPGLYVLNAEGSGLKKLALSEPLAYLGPSCVAWSPDGARLAF